MADTRGYLKAEESVRNKGLPERFHQRFEKRALRVGTKQDGSPAMHEFDAVSENGDIVASIKAHSGKTTGGNPPQGKFNSAFAEVLFLSIVPAREKYLVLTDPRFHELFRSKADGKLPSGVKLLLLPVSGEIQEVV